MSEKRFLLAGAAAWVLAAGMAAGQSARNTAIRHVIVVSVDGLVPETYLNPDRHQLKIPTLREIVARGAASRGARSVFPSVTYPAHTTIATGTNPATHGILTNSAWDPLGKNQDGWRWYSEDIRVPTLWDLAREKGLKTSLLWWPATVGARATTVVPEIWRASTPDDAKLVRALATPALLDSAAKRFPEMWAGITPPLVKDSAITDIGVHVIETLRPHFMMLHIFEVDHWQHEKGLFSAEACAAIENADAQIARLIAAAKKAGTWEQTALVIVSDHGFVNISQRVRPGVLLREKGLVTLDERNRVTAWKAVVLPSAGQAYIYVQELGDTETKRVLRETFAPLAGAAGSGIGRVYTQDEIRALGGDPEAFLALEGSEGFGITSGYTGNYIEAASQAATHGYNPEREDMRASLLIYAPPLIRQGRGQGELGDTRLLDVAPTIARWLGLRLPRPEGIPILLPESGHARKR